MSTIERLRQSVRGKVLVAGDPAFEVARRVRNARIDRRPAVIVRCRCAEDVIAGIDHAQARGLPVAVRGGGAHVAGLGTCDGGVLLDLSPMVGVAVDPTSRTATVGPGVCWGELDLATQRWGLALPGARIPTVGVAGQTLGGGVGDLSRQFGLTCDNATFFELVTARGEQIRASAEQNPELFWGLSGGGGNFGVVTRFGFRLHQVEHVIAGPLAYALPQARAALTRARDWLESAPDQASLIALLWTAPPAPLLPTELHLERCLVLIPTWFGDPAQADALLAPLRDRALRLRYDGIRRMSYLAYHRLLPAPSNYREQHAYNRGEMLAELTDPIMHALIELFARSGPSFSLVFGALGGAMARSSAGATAYPHRAARWLVELCAQWFGHAHDDAQLAPAIEGLRLLRPLSSGPYANLLPEPDECAHTAYGMNHARLVRLKQTWDPHNLLRFNVNLQPEAPNQSAQETTS